MINLSEFSDGVQHIGIPTNDIASTVDFYTGLGFSMIYAVANGDEQVRFLQLGSLVIETYQNGQAVLKDGAIDHIALDVKGIEKLYDEIVSNSYRVLTPGIMSLPFWEHGIKYFIIEGPNKERIEFCEKVACDE